MKSVITGKVGVSGSSRDGTDVPAVAEKLPSNYADRMVTLVFMSEL